MTTALKSIGTKQKALKINLDRSIYGSFAEIGAGQEVAANFFKAGGWCTIRRESRDTIIVGR